MTVAIDYGGWVFPSLLTITLWGGRGEVSISPYLSHPSCGAQGTGSPRKSQGTLKVEVTGWRAAGGSRQNTQE